MNAIRMLRDFPVAPNGWDTAVWLEGSVHEDVADQLAGELIDAGYAALEGVEPEPAPAGKKGKAQD